MDKKTVSALMLTLLSIGIITLRFNIQPVKSEPKTWTVDDDRPANFDTVQDAIDAATGSSWKPSGNWASAVDLPPRYQNVRSNSTSIAENGTVKLYGQGYDGIGLDWAWLWTNETGGSGKNYSKVVSSDSWVKRADMPTERQYPQIAIVNRNIYVIGGRIGADRRDENEVYFPSNDSWSSKSPIPTEEDAAAIGVYNDNIYVAGGYPNGKKHYVYFPSNDSWSDSPADLPVQRWDCGGVVIGDYFYVIGGSSDSNAYKTLYRYNFSSDSWTTLTDMNYEHAKFGHTVYNNEVYIFGSGWSTHNRHVEKYNITSDSWTTLSDIPSDYLRWGAATTVGDVIVLLCGGGTEYTPNFVAYDPATDSYHHLTDLTAMYSLSNILQLVHINSKVYHIGGSYKQNEGDSTQYNHATWTTNVSGKLHDSPIDMNDTADSWTWSNFTWQNSSITSGTTIQWRIYYNDTHGNVNATGIHDITVAGQLYVDPSAVEKTFLDESSYFNVSVMVENVRDLFGFDLNITWDNRLFTFHHCYYNSTLDAVWGENNWFLCKNETGTGWCKLVALSLNKSFTTIASQALFKLEFHVEPPICNSMKETAIHFETHKLSDSNWTSITPTTEDGIYRMTGKKPTLEMNPSSVMCHKHCENFTIEINVLNATNVEDFEFGIQYNATLLDYVNVTGGELGTGNLTIDETTGKINGSVSNGPITGNKWLLNLTFHAAYHHIWKHEAICSDWTNNLTGKIYFRYANLSYAECPPLEYAEGGPYQINVTQVDYTFSAIQGDINNDGDVDVFDLRTIASYYDVKKGDSRWTTASAYDLNCDDTIDIFDLVIVAVNFSYTYP